MIDILAAKQLVEASLVEIAWVPTFRQFADCLTKLMSGELFICYKKEGALCLKETPKDREIEEHRASLRRGQRERRRARMLKSAVTPTLLPSNVKSALLSHG